jgi:PASTA domain
LREYSIPHLRQAGRISIPEDSFDRIREARDLHKEGLGTESVRRQLREGSTPDSGELDRRLATLHQTVENLREDVSISATSRTILARQSLLMSAVFNLTEMVEELLLANGKPRKRIFEDIDTSETLSERPQLEIPGEIASGTETLPTPDRHDTVRTLALRPTDFGALRRRRRRGVLAILAALALAACLAWAITILIGTNNAESSVPRVTKTALEPPEAPKSTAAHEGPGQETETKIPDVSGRSLEEAVKLISSAGFEVTAIETETSRKPPETAIRTNPTSGTPAKPGTPVTLTMSAGTTWHESSPASASAASSTAAATASPSAGYAN